MISSKLIVSVSIKKFLLFNTVSLKNIELAENYFLFMLKFIGYIMFFHISIDF